MPKDGYASELSPHLFAQRIIDIEKKGEGKVQDLINEYNKIVDDKLKEKEEELMTL